MKFGEELPPAELKPQLLEIIMRVTRDVPLDELEQGHEF